MTGRHDWLDQNGKNAKIAFFLIVHGYIFLTRQLQKKWASFPGILSSSFLLIRSKCRPSSGNRETDRQTHTHTVRLL